MAAVGRIAALIKAAQPQISNRQIAETEQRKREREECEAAEVRKAREAERAACYAEQGWPT